MIASRPWLGLAAGLVLAPLPFLRYLHFGGYGEPHADHAAQHGGQLGMAGDHHIEVRRREGKVEAFVSDAWRRPLRPRRAWVVFDDGAPQALEWRGDRLAALDQPGTRDVETIIDLADETRLALSFDFADDPVRASAATQ